MRLRYSPFSPFARKVLVAAFEIGCAPRLKLVPADVWAEDTDIHDDNPIGKVPALISGDGTFVGSTLICEYLDSLHQGPKLIPPAGCSRWTVLCRHALADGIMEAAVAHVVERLRRPEKARWDGWLLRQEGKILCTLAVLERSKPACAFDLANLTLACALAYLDFRLPRLEWRAHYPTLAAWLDVAAERASMRATTPGHLSELASGQTMSLATAASPAELSGSTPGA
jgi:glutathione S-transferase